MKQPYGRLQHAQQLRRTQSPAVLQDNVILFLNLNTRELAQYIQVIRKVLELNEFHLPVASLPRYDGLQRNRGVAMPASGIVIKDVNFLHAGNCDTGVTTLAKSMPYAMWITL